MRVATFYELTGILIQGLTSALEHGDYPALVRHADAALTRGCTLDAARALSRYIQVTSPERRDADWVRATERDIARLPSVSARHQKPHRRVDPRKELISQLKAHNLNPPARKICELIDQMIDRATPIRRNNLASLKSWQMQASGKRSWVELYDDPKTRNRVRAYVNKVPPLKTSK